MGTTDPQESSGFTAFQGSACHAILRKIGSCIEPKLVFQLKGLGFRVAASVVRV